MDTREAYIGLNMIQQIGPIRIRALVDSLGSPNAIFTASQSDLCTVKGIGPQLAEHIMRQREQVNVRKELDQAKRLGVNLITCDDSDYPRVLKQIPDPPIVLYVKGKLLPSDKHSFALVGTRRCTHYGLRVSDLLAQQLAKIGYTINSGLARGIDTAAHQGALKAKGRTIAVLGGAIDCLYPEENRKLSEQIVNNHGALISEFPFGREPDRTTFPYRNRIVSGLSLGVVVIESPIKSGTLITANQAMEHGRAVFAVPGRIDTPSSRGCHQLIKAGAKLVSTVDDILEEFELLIPLEKQQAQRETMKRPDIALSPDEVRIVQALGQGDMNIDQLAREAQLTSSAVSGLLLGLEMKRILKLLPGRRVELCVQLADLQP